MTNSPTAGEVVAELVRRSDEGNNAFLNGDMDRWLKLIPHASDVSVMNPFGGWTADQPDLSAGRLADMATFFKSGTATLELVSTHVSSDLIVLVAIERQRAIIGTLPEQDWSLRVTLVYRRDGADWLLVHRHSDPLVNRITLEKLATLAGS